MAASPKKSRKSGAGSIPDARRLRRRVVYWALRGLLGVAGVFALLVLLFSVLNPPTNIYQLQESARLGGVTRDWVALEDVASVMARSAVAAEDANFCLHWGFDMAAIRAAVAQGGNRGASTISQQVVKNVYLWHGRSWLRKAMEGVLTPTVELIWSKRRILEVYLNVAEFSEGVFGVEAAAAHYFQTNARNLTALQAARLAAVLPDPKGRSASEPSNFVRKRTRAIISGAATIAADGRAGCFQD